MVYMMLFDDNGLSFSSGCILCKTDFDFISLDFDHLESEIAIGLFPGSESGVSISYKDLMNGSLRRRCSFKDMSSCH